MEFIALIPILVFTFKLSPIPTPPTTCNAPVLVEVELVALVIDIALLVVAPLLVTLCNVPVFHIVTAPVDVLTAVSVPAVIADTPYVPKVAAVNTREPLSYSAAAYNAPPTPTPPTTCKAPVFVELAAVALVTVVIPVILTVPLTVSFEFVTVVPIPMFELVLAYNQLLPKEIGYRLLYVVMLTKFCDDSQYIPPAFVEVSPNSMPLV